MPQPDLAASRTTAPREAAPAPARRKLLIGQLARASGRNVHTIRWYESQRLIPGVRRDAQGRRTYVREHVDWLALLERLRGSGMSISELREYTALAKRGASTIEATQELLRAHRARVAQRMKELEHALEVIDAKVDFYEEWRRTGVRPPPGYDHPQRKA
jgi:DNA-binding transcriptional MerR regulator